MYLQTQEKPISTSFSLKESLVLSENSLKFIKDRCESRENIKSSTPCKIESVLPKRDDIRTSDYRPEEFDQPFSSAELTDALKNLADALKDLNEATGKDISEEAIMSTKADALKDLNEATDEAREEGFPIPSDMAITNSEQLIKDICEILPVRFEVYPTPDGEIAIDVSNGKGSSVILFCDSKGGALCMVNINGEHRRAHYPQTDALPDGFVREAFKDLKL